MGNVDDLTLLAEVVEAGSISAASRRTGIPKSRLSRRIEDLESQLGVQLINRGPRSFAVTEIGLSIMRSGQRIREEWESVKALAQDSSSAHPGGKLRIACPEVLTEMFVGEFATNFAVDYPDVRVTLDIAKGQFAPNMENYDLVIQPSREALPDSDIICQKLMAVPYVLVAAPTLFAAAPRSLTLSDLANCEAIGWNADGYATRWKLYGPNGTEHDLDVDLKFSTNSLKLIYQAALKGLGVARLPAVQCRDDIAHGRLIAPLADWQPHPVSVYALYPSRRSLTRTVRTFIAGLSAFIESRLAVRTP
ncbi:LysR family transcriptional regulator [Bradyrhizobium sp. U87765 SZCCT0131]|uniref:LysR substrate-binding domain-containing protein n=1 Tax=unclassified Bradyrhizobium TaxID=2631580 RepID=UPI001BAD372F|nr:MULTISPECIES: LysR substrate-binding domain-containing protein [unclassified Bradyrhizobium]MBR1219838.1 LysR family transcriptional regulator [Bradyrhizobium sp. U87765 SZCCT0131]MBR1262489.1 LysR family transcriptional regulator [Bradyrhizobium sp. U87765 SZCCT0134]MBR1308328.1 LysR family transcriptional regulator [Bradyrhizobium sp. U87765 SZCCT0110]MBR1318271.1 LysR family transcriptional regulator [Bradyrhizobium sp. U87765 SZCCT0109]MBR1351974.1 LysR family transcriptional regulator 